MVDANDKKVSRRSFFKLGVLAVSAIGFGRSVFAAAKTKLSETDTTAVALGYKHDAAKADVAKYPTAKDAVKNGNVCKSCTFYKADATEKGWGDCTLFPKNLVAEGGWCMSYSKKKA